MVDPISVGTIVVAIAAKVFEKALDKGADAAADAVTDAGSTLVAKLRQRFAGRKELEKLEASPDSERNKKALGDVIDAEIVEDPSLAEELQRLVNAAQSDPQYQQSIVMIAKQVNGNVNQSATQNNTTHT